MMFAGLITVAIFGCIGQSYAVKVATQSQEARDVFTLDELYESLHALKRDSNITQTHLKDIEGLLKAAGIPSPSDMYHSDKEESTYYDYVAFRRIQRHASSLYVRIEYIASIAQNRTESQNNGKSSTKDHSGSLLEHIATVLQSQPEGFDYSKIEA
ncbi:hypothetical protein X943_002484 [Babesia divergens]|uniref:Lipoprotein n=1 Tax=Babesia divergens TaxID=32595 RepID=A0AAD9LKS5_BABDI|nr:hypothetical protein X943_002484 [Babesia divergens]